MAAELDTTKAQLAQAARDILLEEGLAGLSMRRVAKACGLSATAIYRHYADKDALVARAVLEGFRTFSSYLMDALEQSTAALRFRAIGQRYVDFSRENPQDYRLMFMTDCEQLGMAQLDEIAKKEIQGTFQMLQDRVAECQRDGLFRAGDPRTLAASVWASIHGLCSLVITGNLASTERETQALVRMHLDLIAAGLAR